MEPHQKYMLSGHTLSPLKRSQLNGDSVQLRCFFLRVASTGVSWRKFLGFCKDVLLEFVGDQLMERSLAVGLCYDRDR